MSFEFEEAVGAVVTAGCGFGCDGGEEGGQRAVCGVLRGDWLEGCREQLQYKACFARTALLQIREGISRMRGGAEDRRAYGGEAALQLQGKDRVRELGLAIGLPHRLVDAFTLQVVEVEPAPLAG